MTTTGNGTSLPVYTAKDFTTDQDVRWCPGCGDYAILTAVRKTLPALATMKKDFVFISGIGCAARFPYYMNTYGMHSIHGRSLPVATGVKLANPNLTVFAVAGDGDLLSIGGNHTIHAMRRNIDINILLINNRIYGLTKGQYSPTSEFGKVTKSTPMGSLDFPLRPLALAAAAECTFIARGIDVDVKLLESILKRAVAHKGTSFIEIYQDCNIFNHKAWFYASQKDSRPDNTLMLEHGKPLIFGKNRDKGIRSTGCRLEVVKLGSGITEDDLLVHDETNPTLTYMLTQMSHPEFPEPLGVFYANPDRPTYDHLLHAQVEESIAQNGVGDIAALLHSGDTWEVT